VADRLRLAELVAALSLATDLGMGQPLEQPLRTCLIALAIDDRLGLEAGKLSDVFYVALLRFLGCTADAHDMAALVGGDEIAIRAAAATSGMIIWRNHEFGASRLRRFDHLGSSYRARPNWKNRRCWRRGRESPPPSQESSW